MDRIELQLSGVVVSPDLQVRRGTSPVVVKQYAQAMKAGAEFPPVEVAELDGVLWLVDGFHRVGAMKALGIGQTPAHVHPVTSLEEARWVAAQANLRHGLALKPGERRGVFRAYVGAFQHRHGGRRRGTLKSYREMAKELGTVHTTLRNWMRSDFPSVFAALAEGGEGESEAGGLPAREAPSRTALRTAREALEAASAVLPGVTDGVDRGALLERVEALRDALLAAGVEAERPF